MQKHVAYVNALDGSTKNTHTHTHPTEGITKKMLSYTNMSVNLHCVCEKMEGEHINIQPITLRGKHSAFIVINNKESPVLPHSPRICWTQRTNTVFESHRFHAVSLISPPSDTLYTHDSLSLSIVHLQ